MQPTITVSQFIRIVDETLEMTFPSVDIVGEISGYKIWNQRLAFFDLKDEGGIINCMIPIANLKTPVENGMQVHVSATPKVTRKGKLSVNVRRLEPVGEGALRRTYELLKTTLAAEGLFASERKRPLPAYPQRIGLITALDSAAYHDFVVTLNSRWQGVEVVALNSQVQGEGAAEQLASCIGVMNQLNEPVEVLILTRGGGSYEDLAVFNSESIVRAIAGSRVPTVVGIGHEVDTVLAELAADVRAATPTDAARRVVPDATEVKARIDRCRQSIRRAANELNRSHREKLRENVNRLERALNLPSQQERVAENRYRLQRSQQQLIDRTHRQLKGLERTLKSFDPEMVLARGYAMVRHNGAIIKQAGSLSVGAAVVIQLAKGRISAEVTNVEDS